MKTSNEIRDGFLGFFKARGHLIMPSYPLAPPSDPTLLFTNAGMVQFKDVFLGRAPRPAPCAASSQCCVRAGGKHNDLENVGYTARHHTFFEMLGNFSFGDYFKSEAIAYAWEFLTEVAGLPVDRLWVTVHADDAEAKRIWIEEIGVPPARIASIATQDNFWSMGDVGPCGPCTEVFYDHGPDIPGLPPGQGDDDDRYVEIWNLVFMQHERAADGSLAPLPTPAVDTGMGIERMAAVLQGVHSNYDTDLLTGLKRAAAELAGVADLSSASLNVIADHARASGFLMSEGIAPSNEGRGYVLRRIIRRAARHGRRLGLREPFMWRLCATLAQEMGGAYPRLREAAPRVEAALRQEEERFAETLETGLAVLERELEHCGGAIPGALVFKLYDTYGFPADLTGDIARERGLGIDLAGFERCMDEQRARARAADGFAAAAGVRVADDAEVVFSGYENFADDAAVRQLVVDDQTVERAAEGARAAVILDRTPCYAESGGQVGDTGRLRAGGGVFRIEDTRKQGATHVHYGVVESGSLAAGDAVRVEIDAARRRAIMRNHSATHLLHAALRRVLGAGVEQKGSLVADDRLRFDFAHDGPVAPAQLREVERLVNARVLDNLPVSAEVMDKDAALAKGAVALFGEKYGERVRVLSFGDFSVELCGGTHVARSGDIGPFKIVSETGVAAGVRRIEAVTGEAAWEYVEAREALIESVCAALKTDAARLPERAAQLVKSKRALEKQLEASRRAGAPADALRSQVVQIDGVQVLAARLDGADRKALRVALDDWKTRLGSAAIVLAAVGDDDKVGLVAGVTKDNTARLNAGELVNAVAERVGGRGGGRADLAEAGGSDAAALDGALAAVPDWVRERLV